MKLSMHKQAQLARLDDWQRQKGESTEVKPTLLAQAQAKLDAKAAKRKPPAEEPEARPVRSFDAADLLAMPMAEPNYIVQSFVPEGVMLWCGRPKMGKTTAARQLVHAVNTGGMFLGEQSAQAEVWFLSLEEGERLFRKKLKMMGVPLEELRGIQVDFEWPQAAEGVNKLRDRLRARPAGGKPVLIIIDSLQRFRIPQSDRGHAFTEDYNAAKLLTELCKEFPGLAVVLLHHTTKAVPDDPVAAISGTYGLTAAVDSYAIMLKQAGQFRLHVGGRLWDRDCTDYELKRDGGTWELVGEFEASTVRGQLAPKQEAALAALKTGAKSNRVLAEITEQSPSALSHMMTKLSERGYVVRIANGWGLA